jgi:hypothetical protein
MAHPVHQFTQACPSRGRQDVARVAKVVNMNVRHAESIDGWAPDALAEVAVPDRLSPGAREDQGISRRAGELVQVRAKLCRDSYRKIDGTVLRSKNPDMVRQEIYGYLLTHYAISALICQAATEADIDPDRVKFLRTVRIIRRRAADPAFPP